MHVFASLFCSERYRDLIEAADTITAMKNSAENVSFVCVHACVCMCVCVHACMCLCVHVYTYICVFVMIYWVGLFVCLMVMRICKVPIPFLNVCFCVLVHV